VLRKKKTLLFQQSLLRYFWCPKIDFKSCSPAGAHLLQRGNEFGSSFGLAEKLNRIFGVRHVTLFQIWNMSQMREICFVGAKFVFVGASCE
jgi:hypothetical protein